MSELPQYEKETEAAGMMKVSKRTLQGWRVSGKGPLYIKLGAGPRAAVVYSVASIAAWLEANERQSTSEVRKPEPPRKVTKPQSTRRVARGRA